MWKEMNSYHSKRYNNVYSIESRCASGIFFFLQPAVQIISTNYVITAREKNYVLTRIGSIAKDFRLMAIVQKVLHMHHFMMDGDEIFVIDIRTHFYAEWVKISFNLLISFDFDAKQIRRVITFITDRCFCRRNPTTMPGTVSGGPDAVAFP